MRRTLFALVSLTVPFVSFLAAVPAFANGGELEVLTPHESRHAVATHFAQTAATTIKRERTPVGRDPGEPIQAPIVNTVPDTAAETTAPATLPADNKGLALQLAQQAFKCRTGVSTRATVKSADDIDWRGDSKRFSVFFQRTSSDSRDAEAYIFRGGTYTSNLSLLSFKSDGRRLTVTCKKPACLAHVYADSGCDENGLCANIGSGSLKKEYLNSFYIELCDASAAKDAADGLTFVSGAN